MRALLKTGEWVELSTEHLFHDQYNTTPEYGNRRIFDNEIARIEDDARIDMGKCKYCGTLVKRGEEEKHFAEREAKPCSECWWFQRRSVRQPETTKETTVEITEDGTEVTRVTTIIKDQYQRQCTLKGRWTETDCINKECRRLGIDWFTKENTFFLKFPNGFSAMGIRSRLRTYGFFPCGNLISKYCKPIGTYTLEAHFENEESEDLLCFVMYNSRKTIRFRYENGSFYVKEWSTWKKSVLHDLPYYAYTGMKKVLGGILGEENHQRP